MRSSLFLILASCIFSAVIIISNHPSQYGSIAITEKLINQTPILNLEASELVPNALGFSQKSVYAAIMAIVLVGLGIVFLTNGYGVHRLFIGLIGVYVFSIAVLAAMNGASTSGAINFGDNGDLIRFLVVILAGLAGFFIFNCLAKIAFFFLGGMMGMVVATVVLSFDFVSNFLKSDTIRFLFIGMFVLVFGLWTFINERVIVIISSCLVGSYSIFVGVDYWIESGFGAFLYHAFYLLEPINFTTKSYAMMAGFALVAGMGMYYQFRVANKAN